MRTIGLALLACSIFAVASPDVAFAAKVETCAPLGKNKAALQALKRAGWPIDDEAERHRFVLALADCNGAPDPEVRDGLAFEATQHLLRKGLISDATLAQLSAKLQAQLVELDKSGFRRSFAALNLSEIARTDRVKAWMTPEQRAQMVTAAVDYMRSIRDYRGFDKVGGYRHAVAHTADLMMQLALNPAVDKEDLARMRDAIAVQVAPASASYITGEPERLARPILFMAQRGVFTDQEWFDWLAQFAGPGALGSWDNAFQSEAGLARRHNVTAFLSAIYVNAQASGADALKSLAAGAMEALKKLP
ncbi:MAG TPA: DUF2785 domain-containing protein [Sphingorhabdus sp.]|uniref:DUF2785 domain-containing protein n=1 Tax=Sphingorhabdus sp. TaxID=1902408 RepID=UPI002BAD4EA6|nr:DUF2785 domain-containing protein [Sphingorhabdus sp.]HMT40775.1 DUF2785 domain-containing protein [Sphingorhabdus sp.]HMU22501.1 DUF2785 domain-containing protein [Sphingorhabdus sp.]